MSDDVSYRYLQVQLFDGLKLSADAAIGLGHGNRNASDAILHARFLNGLRRAEGAARAIGHYRGLKGQGIPWIRLGSRLAIMIDASAKSASQSIANTISADPKMGRGALWIRMGKTMNAIADDCRKATARRSDKKLVIGGREYVN